MLVLISICIIISINQLLKIFLNVFKQIILLLENEQFLYIFDGKVIPVKKKMGTTSKACIFRITNLNFL